MIIIIIHHANKISITSPGLLVENRVMKQRNKGGFGGNGGLGRSINQTLESVNQLESGYFWPEMHELEPLRNNFISAALIMIKLFIYNSV